MSANTDKTLTKTDSAFSPLLAGDFLPNMTNALNMSTALNSADDSNNILNSLPDNAKKYYKVTHNEDIHDVTSIVSSSCCMYNPLTYLLIYPIFRTVYINSNQLLKVIVNGKYKLVSGPGYFSAYGVNDRLYGIVDMPRSVVFGPIKLVYVSPGCVKYAQNISSSAKILLGPGVHYFDDANIEVNHSEIMLNTNGENKVIPVNDEGTLSFLFVKPGFKGVVNAKCGDLKILDSGLHFIEAPDSFVRFASIQQEHFKFGSSDSRESVVFLTADNVELHVNATIFYSVSDVKKLFTTSIKNEKDLHDTIYSQAMSTLMTIIRSENFSDIGKRKMTDDINDKTSLNKHIGFDTQTNEYESIDTAVAVPISSVPLSQNQQSLEETDENRSGFQSIIHDAEAKFMENMQSSFGNRAGFTVHSLRVERIEFADKQMQKQVSELAMTYTQLSAKESTINAQKKVQMAEADREATALMIKAQADINIQKMVQASQNEILKAKIMTENETLLLLTEAQNTASKLVAETEASNTILSAEVEAKKIVEIGNAEVDIINKKNQLANSELRIITDAQKEALRGIEKIVYSSAPPNLLQLDLNSAQSLLNSGINK